MKIRRGDQILFWLNGSKRVGTVIRVLGWREMIQTCENEFKAIEFGTNQRARLGEDWQKKFWLADVEVNTTLHSVDQDNFISKVDPYEH